MEMRSAAAPQQLRDSAHFAPVTTSPASIVVSSLLFFALLTAVPGQAAAAAVFGTGTGFDQNFYSSTTGVTEGVANQQIVQGRAEVDVTSNTQFGVARARAKATPTEFSLGVSADSLYTSFPRTAWSFARTAYTLSGSSGNVALYFTVEGDIPVAPLRQSAEIGFYIHGLDDAYGGPLAFVTSSLRGEDGARFINIDNNALVFGEGESNYDVGSHIVAGLRVLIPANTNGFIAMMFASSNGAEVDFIGTATLTGVELPVGATSLTLDTGQVVPVVPEPGALALITATFAVTSFSRRRRIGTPA